MSRSVRQFSAADLSACSRALVSVASPQAWLCMDSISGKLLHATGFRRGETRAEPRHTTPTRPLTPHRNARHTHVVSIFPRSGGDKGTPGLKLRRGFAHSSAAPLAEDVRPCSFLSPFPLTSSLEYRPAVGLPLCFRTRRAPQAQEGRNKSRLMLFVSVVSGVSVCPCRSVTTTATQTCPSPTWCVCG